MKEHEAVEQRKKLPRVGQTVKNKKYGTLWRIMEKREVWQNVQEDDPKTHQPRTLPGIYLSFWRVQEGVLPGVGRLMGYIYTEYDNTFESNWEIIG
ncbi:MAG: hypothetical protein HQL09_08755 [Nitrospirae bacterium]|nr:hypothetical protein [Nitrospirota bacterium]